MYCCKYTLGNSLIFPHILLHIIFIPGWKGSCQGKVFCLTTQHNSTWNTVYKQLHNYDSIQSLQLTQSKINTVKMIMGMITLLKMEMPQTGWQDFQHEGDTVEVNNLITVISIWHIISTVKRSHLLTLLSSLLGNVANLKSLRFLETFKTGFLSPGF